METSDLSDPGPDSLVPVPPGHLLDLPIPAAKGVWTCRSTKVRRGSSDDPPVHQVRRRRRNRDESGDDSTESPAPSRLSHLAIDRRDRTAYGRDRTSAATDDAAHERDERAQQRDDRAEIREQTADDHDPAAAADRALAKQDRLSSANERLHALGDRAASEMDRVVSAQERADSLVDELTGARRRAAGVLELDRDRERAQRTEQPFTLAFIDVDSLKVTNDLHGHAAGDALLSQIASAIRGNLRPYDLLVRYGGDEFLCGLLGLGRAEVAVRFERLNAELSASGGGSVSFGVAELRDGESLPELIGRADRYLYEQKSHRPKLPT